MGVYIKGMEMPKCCAECDAEGHYENSYGDEYGFFCPFGYKAYTRETRELKRLDDCPLIEVPTPHGRLGDVDALYNHMRKVHDEWRKNYVLHTSVIPVVDDEAIVMNFPTIIPAEELKEEQ